MTMFFYVSLNNNKTFFSHFIDAFCFILFMIKSHYKYTHSAITLNIHKKGTMINSLLLCHSYEYFCIGFMY